MKFLRKIIIKLFVGSYKIGPGYIPRASVIIAPCLLFAGLIDIFSDKIDQSDWWIFMPFAITAAISFIYLQIWPAKYNELDEKQKKQADKLKRFIIHKLLSFLII